MKMQHASQQLAEMQITTLAVCAPSRFMSRQPAEKRSVQFAYLRSGRREYKNIFIRGARTQSRSRQQQSGVYNSITVYLCPPPLHLNNCKIISVVCVFACHRSDTIFEFIYINRLYLHLLNCALWRSRVCNAMRPACCECNSACSNFSHCCCSGINILAQKICNLLHFHTKQSHIYLCSCVHTKRQHCFTPVGTFHIYHARSQKRP
jgi:hypothetical protein